MPIELSQVLLAILLAFVQLLAFGVMANIELGVGYTGGARDEAPVGLSQKSRRLQRAYQNLLETLPWFIGAVLVSHVSNQVDDTVIAAGWVYLIARALYVPVYVIHLGLLRSLVWGIATAAILVIVFKALL